MARSRQKKSTGSPGTARQAEKCPECGKPLAADQRYCVNCGHRRGEPRVNVDRYLAADGAEAGADGAPAAAAGRQWSPLVAVVVLALLAGMLLVGVLIGKNSTDDNGTTTSTTTASGTGTGTVPTSTAPVTPPTTSAPIPTGTTTAPAPGAAGPSGKGSATPATPPGLGKTSPGKAKAGADTVVKGK